VFISSKITNSRLSLVDFYSLLQMRLCKLLHLFDMLFYSRRANGRDGREGGRWDIGWAQNNRQDINYYYYYSRLLSYTHTHTTHTHSHTHTPHTPHTHTTHTHTHTHKHTHPTHKHTALRNMFSKFPVLSFCSIYNQVSYVKQFDVLVTMCMYVFHTDPRQNTDLWSTQYWPPDTETENHNK